jgi:hypothetical protein
VLEGWGEEDRRVGGWEEKGVEWPKGSMRLERCGVGGGGSVVGQWGGCGFFSSAPFCSAPMGSRLCHSRLSEIDVIFCVALF